MAWMQHSLRPRYSTALLTLHYHTTSGRNQDNDNLVAWAKCAIDGLVDAGILEDDKHVRYADPIVSKDSARPRLEILVTPE